MSAETFYVVIDRDGKSGCVGYSNVEDAIAEAKELDYPAVKAKVVTDHDWSTAREFYVWPIQAVVP